MPSAVETILAFDAYIPVFGNWNTPDVFLDFESFDNEDVWQDQGRCTFTVPSPKPAQLVVDQWVVCRINGVRAFAVTVDSIEDITLTDADRAGVKVSCSGVERYLKNGRVHPVRGYGAMPFADTRVFSVFSPDFDISGWTAQAVAVVANQGTPSTYYTGKPDNWQDPTAVLIAPQNCTDHSGEIGQWWVQKDFVAVIDMNVVIDCAADNWADIWVDGQNIGTATGFGSTTSLNVFLKAGTHRFGAKVYNAGDYTSEPPPLNSGGVVTEGNPTFFLMSMFPVDFAGRRATSILHTDLTWKLRAFLPAAPGWTAGEALRKLIDENRNEGLVYALASTWAGGNDTLGAAMPRYEYITVDAGRDLLDVLKEWSTTYLDWSIDISGTAGISLAIYNWAASPVTDSGVHYSHSTTDPYASTLDDMHTTTSQIVADNVIVRWAGGFLREPEVGGYKQGFLKLGACRNEAEARLMAQRWLYVHGVARQQLDAAIAPNNADVYNGNIPYLHYSVGNGIWVAGEFVRVASVRTQLIDGNVIVDAKTKDWLGYIEDRLERAIERMSDGTAGGQAPASPAPSVVVVPHPFTSSASLSGGTNLSGFADGVHAKVLVIPDSAEPKESGIVVKAPSATWGEPLYAGGSADYGKGQFISFHKFGTGLNDSPNNTLLFRVDSTGGLGMTGGMHVATGLRQDAPYAPTQAVWINPTLDLVDIVMTGVAGKTQPFILATSSVGGVLFKVFSNGAVTSAGDIVARSGTALQVALGDLGGVAGIQFGNDSTTFLSRVTTGRVQATDFFDATKDIVARIGDSVNQVVIGQVYGTTAGIGFGTALDTVAYRNIPGQLAVAPTLAVINSASAANVLLTLGGAASQSGDYIRGVNSVGATVWSINSAGVMSPSPSTPSPLSIAGQITAHNADAMLTQIGDTYGYAGVAMGTAGDTILYRFAAGAARIAHTLTVLNTSYPSGVVLAAVGASGQTGSVIAALNSGGGTVFGVSVGGLVTCLSLTTSGGTLTSGALSSTTGNFSGNVGISGTTFSSGISNSNLGIVSTGAVSGVTTLDASGVVTASSFTASSGSSSLRGIANNSNGITSCGSITGATTIDATGVVTMHAGFNAQFAGITSYVNGLSGNNAWATSSSMSANNYITTSSIKLKKRVRDLRRDEHSVLARLRPRRFSFRADNSEHVGLIAEEVERVLPSAVVENIDGHKAIEYNHLLVLLLQGYQQLESRVAELEAA